MKTTPILLLLISLFLLSAPLFAELPCQPLDGALKSRLIAYVSEKNDLGANSDLVLKQEEVVAANCYRRLSFWSGSTARAFVLYLTSDQRFLSPALMDVSGSAAKDAVDPALVKDLISPDSNSPSRGPQDAAVTIVEFSDFQCPYCQQLSEKLKSLPTEKLAGVHIVYKYYPLAKHPWAREAALTAICASNQSKAAFWQMHDFYFSQQSVLTLENVRSLSLDQAAKMGLKVDDLRSCLSAPVAAEEILSRDMILAEKLQIRGTPTVFINGAVVRNLKTAEDLIAAIEAARTTKPAAIASAKISAQVLF